MLNSGARELRIRRGFSRHSNQPVSKIRRMTRLRILHINDTHSHIDGATLPIGQGPSPDEPLSIACGGYALIDAFVQAERAKARAEGIPTVFVHSGDCFEGSLYFSLFQGLADVTLLNRMGLDAMAVGNHEFDRGDDLLASFANQARFPILCSNMKFRDDARSVSPLNREKEALIHYDHREGPQYLVRDIGEEKIALFGLTLTSMADIAAPSDGLEFLDPYDVARDVVASARSAGINKILLLSHLGIEEDRELAAKVPGMSAIIGGHSHTLQGDFSTLGLGAGPDYAEAVGSTVIVHAGQNAMAVGVCEIEFDGTGGARFLGGGNRVLFDKRNRDYLINVSVLPECGDGDLFNHLCRHPGTAFVEEDPDFRQMLNDQFARHVDEMREAVVAELPHSLAYQRIGKLGSPDSVCTLVANAMLACDQRGHTPADCAIVNAGAIRGALAKGPVTMGDIHGRILPFPITLVGVRISGDWIVQALTGALNNALFTLGGTGSFPYTAGLSYEYVENIGGVAVSNVTLFDRETGAVRPLEAGLSYTVLVTSYMARGKEGYGPLRSGDHVNTHTLIADIVTDYLKVLHAQPDERDFAVPAAIRKGVGMS